MHGANVAFEVGLSMQGRIPVDCLFSFIPLAMSIPFVKCSRTTPLTLNIMIYYFVTFMNPY